jgi:hypothetical protein
MESIYKTFFDGMSKADVEKFSTIETLECCNIEQFQSLMNNIGLIEQLANLKKQLPYNEFFEHRPILKWLLNRAIYELALHKMKIVEKTIIDR